MKVLEFALIIIAFVCLFIYRKKLRSKPLALGLLVITCVAHTFLEGWRWQLFPVYLVALFLFLSEIGKHQAHKFTLMLGAALVSLSLGLAVFIPVPQLPQLNGFYDVGIDLLEVERSTDKTGIPIKVWFPSQRIKLPSQRLSSAPWLENLAVMGPEIARRAGLPAFTFNHLNRFNAGHYAKLSSAVLTDKALVLLAHGRGGFKALNSFMALELASQGHIVIAPDFPGGALLTRLQDGTRIPFNPKLFAEDRDYSEAEKYEIIQTLGQNWATDLDTVIRSVKAQYPQLATKQIITGGHSTGAAAAINFCQARADCLGTIGLDAWLKPVKKTILENGSTKPILALFGDQSSGDFEPINQERFSRLEKATKKNAVYIQSIEIKQARHIDFCDAALLSPFSYLLGQQKGRIDARIVMQKINQESLRFIDKTL